MYSDEEINHRIKYLRESFAEISDKPSSTADMLQQLITERDAWKQKYDDLEAEVNKNYGYTLAGDTIPYYHYQAIERTAEQQSKEIGRLNEENQRLREIVDVVFKYIDRMNDACEPDLIEMIVDEFLKDMNPIIAKEALAK